MNSVLGQLKEPKNELDPRFAFLVNELFKKLFLVNKVHLGYGKSITSTKQDIVQSFILKYRKYIGLNIYPAARLIFPNRDRSRSYSIKHTTLGRLIAKIFKIPNSSTDYKTIAEWKKSTKNRDHLPSILYDCIKVRRIDIKGDQVSVDEINAALDELSNSEMIKQEAQIGILEKLFGRMSNEEIKWFLQIILKDSIIGRMENFFFSSWHPDAPDLYNLVSDLQRVFWQLTDPLIRLDPRKQLVIQLNFPFLPQLAFKPKTSYETIARNMNNNFFIEEKLDGERMIMHMSETGSKFKFFSRKTKDYSFLYGSSLESGSITKYLANAFAPGVNDIIVDGEMLAYDFKRDVILPFGTLKAAAMQEGARQNDEKFDSQTSWPLFIVFDLLYLNGHSFARNRLRDRKIALSRAIKPIKNRLELVDYYEGSTGENIEQSIKAVISQRSEGVVVKDPDSIYKVADRNSSWIKIKPEYLEDFGENLDLCVIGMIPGIKDAFMCGLRDKDDIFVSFCTVANGFSVDEYNQIQRMTSGKWHDFFTEKPPADSLRFGKKLPDKWILPQDSFVLEIKARSIDNTSGGSYATGVTLFNLYCRSIREDKSYKDAFSLEDYHDMKLARSHTRELQIGENGHKLIKRKKRKVAKKIDLENFPNAVVKISDLFKDFYFLIVSDKIDPNTGERTSINELSEIVKKYGGEVTLNDNNKSRSGRTLICISQNDTRKALTLFKKGYDLIKPQWIIECISSNVIVHLEPDFCLHVSNELMKEAQKRVDQYGDSFTTQIDENIFSYSKKLNSGPLLSPIKLMKYRNEFIDDLIEQNCDIPLMFVFLNVSFHIIEVEESAQFWLVEKLKRTITKYSGILTSLMESSFIVFPSYSDISNNTMKSKADSVSRIISRNVSMNNRGVLTKVPRIVTEDWVKDSVIANTLVDAQGKCYLLLTNTISV